MRSSFTRHCWLAAILLLSLSSFGCSGDSAGPDHSVARVTPLVTAVDGKAAPQPLAAQLSAGLPPLSALRGTSLAVTQSQNGNEYFQSSPDALPDITSIGLNSVAGKLSWGIWHFNFAQNATDCLVTFASDNSGQAWFAVSDFSRNAWVIAPPTAGPTGSVDLAAGAYVRPVTGDIYIAVLAYNGDHVRVDRLDLNLDVTGGPRTVDASGGFTSLAIVQGRPAIAYYEDVDDDLRYVRANDPWGLSWGQSQIVDGTDDTGLYARLLVVDGNPAIAYHNTTENELRYVRADDALGDSWGQPKILAGAGPDSDGEFCSLALIGGNPAISFYDEGNGSLRYVRSNDAQGTDWPASIQLDANNNCGQCTSLAEVAGAPCIAYEAGGSADLRFIRAMDMVGSSWKPVQDLDTTHDAGIDNSLLVVNGRPAIAFYDGDDSALKYLRANDANGDGWPATALTLDGLDDDRGNFGSMMIVNGKPAISYHSGLFGDLRYITANDADGTTWGQGVILDEESVLTGKYTSLAVVAGHAAISYYDQTEGKLRYTWGFD